jgi:predicted dienelactone hydrolase
MHVSNQFCRLLSAIGFCLTATLAQAAGLQWIDIPVEADGPAIRGVIWYPCTEPAREIHLDIFAVPAVPNCPLAGDHLPLIAFSHGQGAGLLSNHDTAETLADNGFIVAAINHPGDTAQDLSHTDDLLGFVERPTDIKRLIDFMIGTSPLAASIDQNRIGFFGYSRGGYAGLVLIGANPDWAGAASNYCRQSEGLLCRQILGGKYPSRPLTHDPRIKAAVIVDPWTRFFSAESLAPITAPVQLWTSERGGFGLQPHDVAALDAILPAKHEYHLVPNTGHLAFAAPSLHAEQADALDAPGFDRVAFHKEFNAAVLEFFQQHLK